MYRQPKLYQFRAWSLDDLLPAGFEPDTFCVGGNHYTTQSTKVITKLTMVTILLQFWRIIKSVRLYSAFMILSHSGGYRTLRWPIAANKQKNFTFFFQFEFISLDLSLTCRTRTFGNDIQDRKWPVLGYSAIFYCQWWQVRLQK